ncbi:hypothetical protein Acsp02_19700 [Actinoplanes sp. NBRC 103695]|nr:hypothetical protein Acsp02_19700 [Actinoplanes sp. NBRC 103695]
MAFGALGRPRRVALTCRRRRVALTCRRDPLTCRRDPLTCRRDPLIRRRDPPPPSRPLIRRRRNALTHLCRTRGFSTAVERWL